MADKNIVIQRNNAGTIDNIYPQTQWGNVLNKPTTFTPTSHSHGNILNDGSISSATVTPADGDRILIADASATPFGKIERGIIVGTGTTTFLRNDGTWATPAGAGNVTGTGTANQITYWTGTSAIAALSTATYPSLTELSYVKGVTSAIQTQINGKAATSHSHGNITDTGTITADTAIASGQKLVLVNGSNAIVRSALAIGSGTTTFLRNDGTWANPDVFSYASLATSTSRQDTTYTTFLTSPTMDANSRYEVEVSVIFYKTSTAVARTMEYNIIVNNTTGTPTLQLVGVHSNIASGASGMNFYVASTTATAGTTHTTLPSQTGAYTRIFNIKGIVYTGTSTKTISIQDRASATLTGGENVGSGAGSYIKVRKIM